MADPCKTTHSRTHTVTQDSPHLPQSKVWTSVLVQSDKVVIGIHVSSGKHYSQIHICRTTAQWMTFCYIFLLNVLYDWLSALRDWMASNFLQLNAEKSGPLIIAADSAFSEVANSIGSFSFILYSNLRSLCVIFDQAFNIYKRVKCLSHMCLFHLRKIAKLICRISVWNGHTCFCFITPARL